MSDSTGERYMKHSVLFLLSALSVSGFGVTANASTTIVSMRTSSLAGVNSDNHLTFFDLVQGPQNSFEIVELGGNKIAIRSTHSGKYLSSRQEKVQLGSFSTTMLPVKSNTIGVDEIFQRIDLGGNRIALKASNGNYLRLYEALFEGQDLIRVDISDTPEAAPDLYETFQFVDASQPPHVTPLGTSRIIHLSDLHFSDVYEVQEASIKITKEALGFPYFHRKADLEYYFSTPGRIASLGTNVVLITGDLTNQGSEDEYALIRAFINNLTRAGYAVYSTPGNHDYYVNGVHIGQNLYGGDDEYTMRQRFVANCISPWGLQTPTWPQVSRFGKVILITLDSVQGELDEWKGDNWSQGYLGTAQMSALPPAPPGLQTILDGLQWERKFYGKKILVALHHDPFLSSESPACVGYEDKMGLRDSCLFLNSVKDKIDGLAFGHTGPVFAVGGAQGEQGFISPFDGSYGIALVNSVNLEDANNDAGLPIPVIDLDTNRIEIFNTNPSVNMPPPFVGLPPAYPYPILYPVLAALSLLQ